MICEIKATYEKIITDLWIGKMSWIYDSSSYWYNDIPTWPLPYSTKLYMMQPAQKQGSIQHKITASQMGWPSQASNFSGSFSYLNKLRTFVVTNYLCYGTSSNKPWGSQANIPGLEKQWLHSKHIVIWRTEQWRLVAPHAVTMMIDLMVHTKLRMRLLLQPNTSLRHSNLWPSWNGTWYDMAKIDFVDPLNNP